MFSVLQTLPRKKVVTGNRIKTIISPGTMTISCSEMNTKNGLQWIRKKHFFYQMVSEEHYLDCELDGLFLSGCILGAVVLLQELPHRLNVITQR